MIFRIFLNQNGLASGEGKKMFFPPNVAAKSSGANAGKIVQEGG
jgi:hypothetical protein